MAVRSPRSAAAGHGLPPNSASASCSYFLCHALREATFTADIAPGKPKKVGPSGDILAIGLGIMARGGIDEYTRRVYAETPLRVHPSENFTDGVARGGMFRGGATFSRPDRATWVIGGCSPAPSVGGSSL